MGAEVTLGWILSSEPSELLFPRRKFPVFKDNGHTLHPTTFVSLDPLPNSPRARPTASLSWPGLPEYLKRARETKKILRTSMTVTDSVPLLTLNRTSHGEEPPTSWSQMPINLGMYRGFNAFKNVSCLSPLNFGLLWPFESF